MVSCGVLNNSKLLNKLYIKGMVHAVALGPVRTGRDVKKLGRIVLAGVYGKKYLGRLRDDPWGSGVGDIKDPRHATPS